MSLVDPKTDWKPSDYFNATDYNRIIGNLRELKTLALKVYADFVSCDLGANKDYTSLLYAEEVNNIEDYLETIKENTFPFPIGDKKVYVPNGKTIDYNELNRIESATIKLYNEFTVQLDNLTRLQFRLGTERGIRV